MSNMSGRPRILSVLLSTFVMLCASVSAEEEVGDAQDTVVKDAVRAISDSVVQIQTSGGRERIGRMLVSTGPTTGLVVSSDGFMLSSAFNFIQNPASIVVRLSDGTKKAARLIARDHSRMLVLLKVDTDEPLAVPVPIPHDEMRVGQWSIAVGRTFVPETPNLSVGILSATNRVWGKAIQTDAKVSPSNYGGPLIDVQGRVYGILVPLSPQQQTEVAGAEWYDSGIGFAIPLIDLQQPIERMKAGESLFRGILGVTLKGSNMFSDPAVVAVSVRNSPAAKAGIEPKDRIIEIDGQPIRRQTQLKHALGPRYAGETIKVVALRKARRIEFDVELAARVDPYQRPYIGFLPRDADDRDGVVVRFVLPDSPAEAAGLKANDRITTVSGESVADAEALREQIANREPGQQIDLDIVRDGEEDVVSVNLSGEPDDVPDDVPPRQIKARTGQESTSDTDSADDGEPSDVREDVDVDDRGKADAAAKSDTIDKANTDEAGDDNGKEDGTGSADGQTRIVSVSAAAEPNKCFALIPATYDKSQPHGVIVWLSAPEPFEEARFRNRWADLAERHQLIVLAPQPNDQQRWVVTEVPVIAKLFQQLDRDFAIDPHRVVVHGYQGGASLAYRFAFENRAIVHGVAAVDAALPLGVQPRGNDSVEHLAFWIHSSKESRRNERIEKNVQRFRDLNFPVTNHTVDGAPRYLNPGELRELAIWADIQDRI